jgi:TP901 family phage tail tape measure protein
MINLEKKTMTEQMCTSARIQRKLTRFGFDENEISEITESVIRLADATGEKLDKVISVTVAVLHAYSLKPHELGQAISALIKSITNGMQFSYLTDSLEMISPISAKLGFTVEDTIAAIKTFADSGLSASDVATKLRNNMLDILNKREDTRFDTRLIPDGMNPYETLYKAVKIIMSREEIPVSEKLRIIRAVERELGIKISHIKN